MLNPAGKYGINQYLTVIGVILLTALLCRPLANQQGYHIVSYVLLFTISIMAVFLSIGPILLASTLSALVWNFFFIPPHFELQIEKTEDKLMFVSFFIIALINGALTNRIRRQEKLALEREERTNSIFELTRELADANGIDEILEVASEDLRKYFNVKTLYFLKGKDNNMQIFKKKTGAQSISGVNTDISRWVYRNSATAGRFTEFFEDTALTYYPLAGKRINPGVLAIELEKPLTGEKEAFWKGYLTQIANALERENLSDLAIKARLLEESDKLYKTLFTLISHEFRIPISTIIGASDTLLLTQAAEPERTELLNEIYKASARLNHLVENLLNMSRLESGKISVRLDWCDLNDLVNRVIKMLEKELEQFSFESNISSDMPLVKIDFGLIEQVIYNLILNSCQHTGPGTKIRFDGNYRDGYLNIVLSDNGPGFPAEMIVRAFDKFFRVDSSRSGGLGLGLSIVKGLVEAHKGKVRLENIQPTGSQFTITIPTDLPDIGKIKSQNE